MEVQTHSKRPLTNAEVVSKLRKEAATDKVFNAVCYVFAMRERARHQVTLASLRLTLYREGFMYKSEDIAKSLKFLSDLGVGRLEKNLAGNISALKDVTITLQSIGKSALSDNEAALKAFRQPHRFISLKSTTPAMVEKAKTVVTEIQKATENPHAFKQRFYSIPLKTKVQGKEIDLSIKIPLTEEQIGLAVAALFEKQGVK